MPLKVSRVLGRKFDCNNGKVGTDVRSGGAISWSRHKPATVGLTSDCSANWLHGCGATTHAGFPILLPKTRCKRRFLPFTLNATPMHHRDPSALGSLQLRGTSGSTAFAINR